MLTATAVRNAKPKDRPYKLFDGHGLYLEVTPDGAKRWRLKYRVHGREKRLSFGVCPPVTLGEARDRRDEARRLLRDGKDPSAERQALKRQVKLAERSSFRAVAEEWFTKLRNTWEPAHAKRVKRSLELNIFPDLGDKPIADIEPPELLAVLRKIESRGTHEARQRAQQRTSAVFRYGIATGRCLRDPASDLRGAFTPPKATHHAALGQTDLPDFFQRLAKYDGEPTTKLALRLLALTFVRTAELRGAEWQEFDLDAAEWRIPAERMKMREAHIVPLSSQAVEVLRELESLTGKEQYVFPNKNNPAKCMSENTVLYALYRMGYHSRATGHGFRATASTILNEQGFNPDVIERQLAHVERNKVRAAYNRAMYLRERRNMMQHWANYLDAVASGTTVISGRFRATAIQ